MPEQDFREQLNAAMAAAGGGVDDDDDLESVLAPDYELPPPTRAPLPRGRGRNRGRQGMQPASMPEEFEEPTGSIPNIAAWLGEHIPSYAKGTDYVQVVRQAPAVFANIPTKGWLFDALAPFDEEYLANIWGGGNYILTVYRADSRGSPRPAARGWKVISGDPRAVRGPTGEPSPLPESTPKMMATLPGTTLPGLPHPVNGQPVVAAPPASVAVVAPTAPVSTLPPPPDLVTLLKQFQEGSSNPRVHDQLQNLQNQLVEHMKTQQERTAAELERARSEMTKTAEEKFMPYRGALDTMQNQLSELRQQHQANIDSMRMGHEAAIKQLVEQHRNELQAMKESHQQALSAAQVNAQMMITSTADQRRVEVDGLRRDIDNMRATHQRDIDTMRDLHRQEVNSLRDEMNRRESAARDSANAAANATIETLKMQLASLTEQANRRVDDARATLQNQVEQRDREIARLREERDRDEARVRDERERELARVRQESEKDLERARQDAQRDIDRLREEIQRVREDGAKELDRVREELARERSQVEQLRVQAQEKADPIETVRKFSETVQTFQAITGQDKPTGPAPEPEPTSFIGQLAKAAPQLKDLAATVMGPVQESVNLAKKEIESRDQARRAAVLMQRQQVEQAMMARQQQALAQQQGRRPGQGLQPQGGNFVPVPVPGQYQQPVAVLGNPVPQQQQQQAQPAMQGQLLPAQQPQSVSSRAEIPREVLVFINDAMVSGQSPKAIVDQMVDFVKMGMIPKESIEEIQAMPSQEFVEGFASAARKEGIVELGSPQGEVFLAELHRVATEAVL